MSEDGWSKAEEEYERAAAGDLIDRLRAEYRLDGLTEGEREWLAAGLRQADERSRPWFVGPTLDTPTEDLLRRQLGLPERNDGTAEWLEAVLADALRPRPWWRRLWLWLKRRLP